MLREIDSAEVKQADKLIKVYSRPNMTMEHLAQLPNVSAHLDEAQYDPEVLEQGEVMVKYAGYIAKEKLNADKLNRLENIKIPKELDYHQLKSLSYEAREKLTHIKPATLSQASRVSGVSPADLSVLLVLLCR